MTDRASLARAYRVAERRKAVSLLLAFAALAAFALWACGVGVTDLSLRRILATYLPWGGELLGVEALDGRERNVLILLRAPRVFMALAAGAALALSGAAMQAITVNAMASPFTTGLSSAASLGAAAAILFLDVPVVLQKATVVAAAFGMTSLCAVLVYGLSSLKGLGSGTLVLTGIALNYLFSAFNATMQYLANEQQLPAIVHWTFGNLTGANWTDVAASGVVSLLGLIVFWRFAAALDLLATHGDEGAAALGVDVRHARLVLGGTVTLLTAAIVSVTGTVGFVGLVAPHIARLLAGGRHRELLPLSALVGAFLMLAADTAGRTLFAPSIVPVGIVVSYLGVPAFLYLILRERGRVE